jgi:hypothetical protein
MIIAVTVRCIRSGSVRSSRSGRQLYLIRHGIRYHYMLAGCPERVYIYRSQNRCKSIKMKQSTILHVLILPTGLDVKKTIKKYL